MAANSQLSDLRVLCRKLTTIPPGQLPHCLPALINHVIRCKDQLSLPLDQKSKDKSSDVSMLVHKLKTRITNLLSDRSPEARFAAVALVKAAVDVGGWEVLQSSQPWVQSLMTILQKNDPFATKELALVTLTRLYSLMHAYQTLVREIVTPQLPHFANACLQILKSSQTSPTPSRLIETICDSLSTLIPRYPTTLRPFNNKLREATRRWVAPTASDGIHVASSLQVAAQRLVIHVHFTTAKVGGTDDWGKHVKTMCEQTHSTLDQVFRVVEESWEDGSGHARSKPDIEEDEPQGGSIAPDDLPPWSGLSAGAQRVRGLLVYLANSVLYPTKAGVSVPISLYLDVVARICMIARLSPKTQSWDQAIRIRAGAGREEKEELWAEIADLHVASMQVVVALLQRLSGDMLPFVSDILDHLVRIFHSGITYPAVRSKGYAVLNQVLPLAGPTLTKATLDLLEPLFLACCRDLQEATGHMKTSRPTLPPGSNTKKNGVTANADLFLQPQASEGDQIPVLDPTHQQGASKLLSLIFSRCPQHHLKPSVRGLLDQTAIVTGNRDAMIASVLNPYRDQRGRLYPNILPHLTQQYPDEQELEIIRTNLHTYAAPNTEDLPDLMEEALNHGQDDDEAMVDTVGTLQATLKPVDGDAAAPVAVITQEARVPVSGFQQRKPEANNTWVVSTDAQPRAASPPKRKSEESPSVPAKRQELETTPLEPTARTEVVLQETVDEEEDSDDESVQLNMQLEGDDDESDEDDK